MTCLLAADLNLHLHNRNYLHSFNFVDCLNENLESSGKIIAKRMEELYYINRTILK